MIEEPVSILRATEPEPSSKTSEPAATGDLDFSDLKRKKKKKTVTLDLDEDELKVIDEKDQSAATTTAAEDAAAAEEFAGWFLSEDRLRAHQYIISEHEFRANCLTDVLYLIRSPIQT